MANPNQFQNFHIAAKGILVFENKALVVKSTDDGYWEIPGGRIDKDEWYEDSLKREMLEELGVEIPENALVKLIAVNQADKYKQKHNGTDLMLMAFAIKLESEPQIQLGEEHDQYMWVSINELKSIKFRTDTNIQIYTEALNVWV